ncbi:hypothetical protein D1007_29044 [Hordeum vulgare]|nr:hypothetical protein D1007_29044 [Hordeum vulgare]
MVKVMLVLFLIFPLLSQSKATTTYKEITFDLQNQSFVELVQALVLHQPPPPRAIAADTVLKDSLVSLMLALTDGLKAHRNLLSFDECGQAMQRLSAHRQPPPARLIMGGFMNKNQSFVRPRQPPSARLIMVGFMNKNQSFVRLRQQTFADID